VTVRALEPDRMHHLQARSLAMMCEGRGYYEVHSYIWYDGDWLKTINQYGGTMGETYGVPVAEIVEGIKHGVRKINIDTDLRMASTGAIRKYLAENTKDFDPRKYLAAARKAMKEICVARYQAFGCAGQAGRIKPVSLEKMAERYKKGELNAIVK
jgi:fructose-bisphosphate aldolase class II